MAWACIWVSELVVDALGGLAQCELAQRRQIAGREIVGERPLGGARHIDLAVMQALDQIIGRQIDDLDVVGKVDDRVRHCLAHADAGDLRDDVVQALDMLDVQRRIDVDAAIEQFLDVEIALRMAAALGIGMGEFVDQHEIRPAGEDAVEVHLLERPALVADRDAGDDLEAGDESFGLLAAVGLDDADDDIETVGESWRGRRRASRRSCRHRGQRRERSSDGRAFRPGLFREAHRARALPA